jgi:REP element-mobilizing transposase RayT
VYSTEARRDLIRTELQAPLWAFIGNIARQKDIPLICAGGIANHCHLLIALPPAMPLAKALQTVKAYSSRWMSEQGVHFKWQEGYGAFSVSPSQLDMVVNYIRNQAQQHAKRSFEEEFVFLLKSSGVDYDPRYVFG